MDVRNVKIRRIVAFLLVAVIIIAGRPFDGGDDTVYQTNWKTKTIDISSYQSQFIKIKFLVYDVGDSAYDTAVVIDDISWR